MAIRKAEIAVVGGGVVGAAAALSLLRQGFDVVMIEKGKAPPTFNPETYDARVYAIAPGSARFLDRLGVWARVAAQRISPYTRMQVWETSPLQSLNFDAAELVVHELGHIVEDSLLRASLWGALPGAAVLTGLHVESIGSETLEKPRLRLSNGDTLDVELVVAAEGADSPLREMAGIDSGGWAYPQRSIVGNVTTERPHGGVAHQRFLPNGPLAFLPLADGRSSIVWSTDTREAEELMRLPDAEFLVRLDDAFQHHLGAMTAIGPRHAFPLRALHADTYVAPGVALVGDAAHVIHPLAGQGLNLGLADVEALAAVLGEARQQKRPLGSLRVLQRYERRRKADNLEAMALTDGLYRLFKARSPAFESLREVGMSMFGRAGMVKQALAKRAMGL